MSTKQSCYKSDVIVVGGGLAGLVACYELLSRGKKVVLFERDTMDHLGGLAKNSFGGVLMVGTPLQKRSGIKDSPELALEDWHRYANFADNDYWPKRWASHYMEHSIDVIYEWLTDKGVTFLPVVNWPERGMKVQGNSVPRWHIAWGTGFQIIKKIINSLMSHPKIKNLKIETKHRVDHFIKDKNGVVGCSGSLEDKPKETFEAYADAVVVACGGVSGGDHSFLKQQWDESRGKRPEHLLNGSHRYADGLLHSEGKEIGASLTHLDKQWFYAAGVHHPSKDPDVPNKGLSLVPPRSALWLNALGERIGPTPLVGYTDTSYLVDEILKQPGQYSWQVLNWNIAIKELAVSGCQYMTSFLKRNKFKLLWELLFGNTALVKRLIKESKDFVVADSLEELAVKMQNLTKGESIHIDRDKLIRSVRLYDQDVESGEPQDFQLKKIQEFRNYRGDKMRIARSQRIENKKALPLIAIREFILTRKSLGGFETNLSCQVLHEGTKDPIPGLYAVGEASGFGGGGIHGQRSLEGTFLGSCVLTGHQVAHSLS